MTYMYILRYRIYLLTLTLPSRADISFETLDGCCWPKWVAMMSQRLLIMTVGATIKILFTQPNPLLYSKGRKMSTEFKTLLGILKFKHNVSAIFELHL